MKLRRRGTCYFCGRSDFVDAIDNQGDAYRGCAHCTIKLTAIPATWAP